MIQLLNGLDTLYVNIWNLELLHLSLSIETDFGVEGGPSEYMKET